MINVPGASYLVKGILCNRVAAGLPGNQVGERLAAAKIEVGLVDDLLAGFERRR